MPRHLPFALLALTVALAGAADKPAPGGPFATTLAVEDLDPASYAQWVDGTEKPIEVADRSAPCNTIRECLLSARCKLAPSPRCGAIRSSP